jgi:hypothetical protein
MDEKHETAIDSFNGYSICTPAAMGLAASRVESPIPPPPKRTAVKRSPFEDPACLRLIHDYLGAGHHSFIAPVSKLWKQSYEATPSLSTTGFDVALMKIPLLCDSKTTLYSAIFTSTSRVQSISKELLLYACLNTWGLLQYLQGGCTCW